MDINEPGTDVKSRLVTVCPKKLVEKLSLQGHISNQQQVTLKLAPIQCSECFTSKQLTKVFSTRRLLNSHIRQCHGEPRFKCQVCFKPFVRRSNLKQHMYVHSLNTENKHKCDLCQATFIAKCHLKRHLFQVHKQKIKDFKYFKCEFCPQEFVHRNYLETHVVEEHVVDKEFGCPICSRTFIDQQHLDKHIRTHDVELKYFCQLCFVGFRKIYILAKHLKVKHSQFYCSNCFTSFSNKLKFDQHLDSKTSLQFKCGICSDILSSQCNLNIHKNSHLKEDKLKQVSKMTKAKFEHQFDGNKVKILPVLHSTKTETNKLGKINCDLCLKSFDCESNLKCHRNKVHPQTMWACNYEQCSKTFKYYNQLKRHRFVHSNNKSYKCAICPQYFKLPRNVKSHVANHHQGLAPFKCPVKICATSFFNYSTLHRHSVCHQTQNNNLLKCNLCLELKSFTTSSNFKRHLRQHSNISKANGNSMALKSCDDAVFVCSSNKCSFQTRSEKKLALHYNQQHGLPTVVLSQNINIKIEINFLE